VLVGRPWVYGLACAGADGLRHVLRSLLADYDLAMALSGQRRPGDLSPDLLRPA
jgi:isopentenyl diphosphate isomerase/L-lactate dehydrogenase-like FMN-dependent dehydrogenase